MNAPNGGCNQHGATFNIRNVNQLNNTNTAKFSNNTVTGGMPLFTLHRDNANVSDTDGANNDDPILQPGQNGGGQSGTASNHNSGQNITNNQYCSLGLNNLPRIPSYVLPKEKKSITANHCKQPHVWAHFWILDAKQRRAGKTICFPTDDCAVENYVKILQSLFESVIKTSRDLTENKVCAAYNEEGFRWNSQTLSGLGNVRSVVTSRLMKDRFEMDILYPFCYNFKCVYSNTQESVVHEWLTGKLIEWARSKILPFDFDTTDTDPDSWNERGLVKDPNTPQKMIKHNIIKIGVKGTQYATQVVHEAEEGSFGMSLRTKKSKKAKFLAKYAQIRVNFSKLGFNPRDVTTYLIVDKSRYPWAVSSDVDENTMLDSCATHHSFYSHLVAHDAKVCGMKKEELIASVAKAYDFMTMHISKGLANPDESAMLPLASRGFEMSVDKMPATTGNPAFVSEISMDKMRLTASNINPKNINALGDLELFNILADQTAVIPSLRNRATSYSSKEQLRQEQEGAHGHLPAHSPNPEAKGQLTANRDQQSAAESMIQFQRSPKRVQGVCEQVPAKFSAQAIAHKRREEHWEQRRAERRSITRVSSFVCGKPLLEIQ